MYQNLEMSVAKHLNCFSDQVSPVVSCRYNTKLRALIELFENINKRAMPGPKARSQSALQAKVWDEPAVMRKLKTLT